MTIDQSDPEGLFRALDASFGDGPALPAPADRLVAGRRSLRRRRLSVVAGSASAVAVVVAASFAVLGPDGTGPQGTDPMAPAPSATTGSTDALAEERQAALDRLQRQAQRQAQRLKQAQLLVSNRTPAALDTTGTLVLQDGWTVTRRVEEPMGYRPPEASLGVVVTDGTRTRWMLLTLERAQDAEGNPLDDDFSSGSSSDEPGKGYSRFEDWLASMVSLQGGPATSPLVEVTAADEVVPGAGWTLLDVQEIEVIEGYTSPGDRVARLSRDGRVWFVVIRGHGPDAELIPVDGAVLPESTLAALLTYVTQQAASGEGVR